jgi:hypothetical protein
MVLDDAPVWVVGAGCSVAGQVRNEWTRWRKSRHSTSSNCVEVRLRSGRIEVRDSKNPDGPVLRYTAAEWDAFIAGAKDGEFDRPA